MSEKDHKVSRRQFLSYTLTGVGGFMAAGMLMPMVRFALDPALKANAAGEGDKQLVCDVKDLTDQPKSFKWSFEQPDSWYTSTVSREAYIYLNGEEVVALSSTCTHLGCTIAFKEDKNEFQCPCHGGRFERDGTNIKGTPPTRPLDVYDVSVEDGKVYLGEVTQRK